jgi:hypothetical protein
MVRSVRIPGIPGLVSATAAIFFSTALVVAPAANGQVPGILNHQGRLAVHGTNFQGTAQFKFSLVTTNGAGDVLTLWSHNGTGANGAEPASPALPLPVTRGVFSVQLGDTSVPGMAAPISPAIFTNSEIWLRVWVDDGVNGSQWMSPDRRLTSAGYAMAAGSILGVAPAATNFTGGLVGDVTGLQSSTLVQKVGGATAADIATATALANAATNLNQANSIVRRDADGSFSAGTITGTFSGNGQALTQLTAVNLVGVAPAATNFTGRLVGDVSGPQTNAVVDRVGGVAAAAVASGANRANAATSSNVLGSIVFREDCYGDFDAGTVRAKFVGDGSGLTNLPTTPVAYQAPSGSLLVSLLESDAALIAAGYRLMSKSPAPGWVNGTSTGAPSARSGHSTVWTGTEMLVWGGSGSSGTALSSGGGYNPETDTWNALTTVGAPAARSGHTVVWTGSEMIVWGGQGGSGNLGNGGRYLPASQTWGAVSTTGAPTPRQGHVAVWTGSRMFVWGGLNIGGLLNDGALYDPALNQWTPVSLPDAPEGRMLAAAVWTGDSFVVWGGQGELGPLASGGRLVFTNGVPSHWLALNPTNAPAARIGHTAAWMGDKMFVWGGKNGGVPFGDGAAYCAHCDTWFPIAATNAPSARFDHTVVVTTTEMVVLGGSNNGGDLATGAAYDPAVGEWHPLSTLGAPLARAGGQGVWTGTELVVFGGRSAGSATASTQRLVPQPTWYFYRKL